MSPPASCLSPVHLRGQQRSGCAEGQDRTCIFPSSPKRSWQGLGGRSPEKSAQTLGTEATSPGRRSSLERGRPLSPAASPGGRRAGPAQTDAALRCRRTGPSTARCLPAASLPLRPSQTVWRKVLPPRTPVTRAEGPAKLSPSGARGCFALKTRASKLRRLASSSSFGGGWAVRRAPGGGLGTRWDLLPPWWTHRPSRASGSPEAELGRTSSACRGCLGG